MTLAPKKEYTVGMLYSLAEIKSRVPYFKSKADLNTANGLFHLYNDKAEMSYWIGGPHHGPDSNSFLFLGVPSSEHELKKTLSKLRIAKPTPAQDADDLFQVDEPNSFLDFADQDFDFGD